MKLEEAKKKYKDEWLLLEVLEADEKKVPKEVRVIEHSKNREETYGAMNRTKAKHISHFYNGKIPKKGYSLTL